MWLGSLLVATFGILGSSASINAVWPFWIPKKQLTISVISIGPQLPTTLDSDFEVSYLGKKVGNIATFLIEIRNSGREEVHPDDFVQPLTFPITGINEVYSIEHMDLDPENPIPFEFESINPTNSSVILKPLLLNRGDSGQIMIRAFCDRVPKMTLDARARIAGISKLNFQDGRPKPPWLELYSPLISTTTILLLIAIVLRQSFINSRTEQKLETIRQDTKSALWSHAASKLRVISYELEKENLSGLATWTRVSNELKTIFEDQHESGDV